MIILKLPLPDNHIGIVEQDDDLVILYIEEPTKIFFGLFTWSQRCTRFEVFTLSNRDEDRGVDIERMIHGTLGRYQLRYRDIETFDPKTELLRIWSTYEKDKTAKQALDKRVKAFQQKIK